MPPSIFTKLCASISNLGVSLLYEKVVKLIKNPATLSGARSSFRRVRDPASFSGGLSILRFSRSWTFRVLESCFNIVDLWCGLSLVVVPAYRSSLAIANFASLRKEIARNCGKSKIETIVFQR